MKGFHFLVVMLVLSVCFVALSEEARAKAKSDHRLRLLNKHLSTRSAEQSPEEKHFVSSFLRDQQRRVLVSLELRSTHKRSGVTPLPEFIRQRGGRVEGNINDQLLEAYVPLSILEELEEHDHVHYINLVPPFVTSAGKANSQAGPALGIPTSGNANGVKVGILSDSVNKCPSPWNNSLVGLAGSIATGDLGPISSHTIVKDADAACGVVTDEGRAMAEVIYDLAPGVHFYYYNPSSPSDFAAGIKSLKSKGCRIIVDDLRFLGDPIYQDGVVAQAVNQVTAQNASYFTAAGNLKNAAYQANFTIGTATNFNFVNVGGTTKSLTCHKFPSGSIFLPLGTASQNVGLSAQFVLSWAVPFHSLGGPSNPINLDLIISSKATSPPKVLSTSGLSSSSDPYEYSPFMIDANTQVSICVSSTVTLETGQTMAQYVKYNGAPVLFKLMYNQIGLFNVVLNSATTASQQNAFNAITVGAIDYESTCRSTWNHTGCTLAMESYSSLGGQNILYLANGTAETSVRNKPDITGPDCGDTSFFGQDIDGNGLDNFCGTSAAAPAIAAVGARLLARCPGITWAQMKNLLKNSATDIPPAGYDKYAGNGLPLWSKISTSCP